MPPRSVAKRKRKRKPSPDETSRSRTPSPQLSERSKFLTPIQKKAINFLNKATFIGLNNAEALMVHAAQLDVLQPNNFSNLLPDQKWVDIPYSSIKRSFLTEHVAEQLLDDFCEFVTFNADYPNKHNIKIHSEEEWCGLRLWVLRALLALRVVNNPVLPAHKNDVILINQVQSGRGEGDGYLLLAIDTRQVEFAAAMLDLPLWYGLNVMQRTKDGLSSLWLGFDNDWLGFGFNSKRLVVERELLMRLIGRCGTDEMNRIAALSPLFLKFFSKAIQQKLAQLSNNFTYENFVCAIVEECCGSEQMPDDGSGIDLFVQLRYEEPESKKEKTTFSSKCEREYIDKQCPQTLYDFVTSQNIPSNTRNTRPSLFDAQERVVRCVKNAGARVRKYQTTIFPLIQAALSHVRSEYGTHCVPHTLQHIIASYVLTKYDR